MRRVWIAALLLGLLAGVTLAGEPPKSERAKHEDAVVRAAARLSTAPIDDLHRAMMSSDVVERRAAATVAGRRTTESEAVFDELVAATGDDDTGVRLAATRALGEAGRIEAVCIERLSRLAEHATDTAQRRALRPRSVLSRVTSTTSSPRPPPLLSWSAVRGTSHWPHRWSDCSGGRAGGPGARG